MRNIHTENTLAGSSVPHLLIKKYKNPSPSVPPLLEIQLVLLLSACENEAGTIQAPSEQTWTFQLLSRTYWKAFLYSLRYTPVEPSLDAAFTDRDVSHQFSYSHHHLCRYTNQVSKHLSGKFLFLLNFTAESSHQSLPVNYRATWAAWYPMCRDLRYWMPSDYLRVAVCLGVHNSNAGVLRAQRKIRYQIPSAEHSQQNLVLHLHLKPMKAIILFSFWEKQMFLGQLPKHLSHIPNKTSSKQYLQSITWHGKYHHLKSCVTTFTAPKLKTCFLGWYLFGVCLFH